jgi:glycosyltransferase involved in cell wall biosynthesis
VKPAGIDVIVPCYNYGGYLRRCTASVLQETRLPIRVLIIDDASTDGSAAEALKIAAEDSRVQVIRHSANQGHIATYNEGIAWVEAAYMLLLSADDMVAPGALARAATLMETNPGIAFVYGGAVRFSDENELARVSDAVPDKDDHKATVTGGVDFIRGICADPRNPVETATAVVRSAVQKRVGGYNSAFPHAGDLEMWLRCAAHGDVGMIGVVQGFVRLHDGNMRRAYVGAGDYRQRRETFRHFFDSHKGALADAERLKQQAFSSLAREILQEASNSLDNGRPHAWLIELAREICPAVRPTWPYWKVAIKGALAPRRASGPRNRPQETALASRESTTAAEGDVLISLIVSTRDRAGFLAPCLQSLRDIVTTRAWEIVIVDNGSVDDTWAILTDFAQQSHLRVTLVREPAPGLSRARNAGVRAASGGLFCFTDDDCYPSTDFIDAIAQAFEDDDLGFLGGRVLLHDPEDAPVCITDRTSHAVFPRGTFITTGEIQGACMAFRRAVFEDVGLFDTAFGAGGPLKGAEDCEMVVRASFAGWNGAFFTEPVIYHHHRRRADGASQITSSYDYSRGAFFAKLILRYPRRVGGLLRQWYWDTPVFARPTRRTFVKLWRELRGACRYALAYSWSSRAPSI